MSFLNTENYSLNGTLPSNAVSIELAEKGKKKNLLTGLAAQQVQASVQKGVRPVYEIGSPKYYIIDGRPQGQGQIAYLFGPSKTVLDSVQTFASLCHPCTLTVRYNKKADCVGGGAAEDHVSFVDGTLTSFSIQATSQDFMVTGNIGFIFMDVQRQ